MADRLGPRFALFVAFVAALVVGVAGGSAAGSACIPSSEGPEVCLEVVGNTENPVASTAEAPTFTSFSATVDNRARNKVTHVELEVGPIVTDASQGFTFFSASPSVGTCSYSAASSSVTCELGSLGSGAQASVELVLGTPAVAGPAPLDFVASVDEGGNDNPDSGGKRDTVSLTEVTTVQAVGGPTASSFAPEGVDLNLGIAQQGQQGSVTLPAQEFSTTADLQFTGTDEVPFACPSVCRGGDWFTATIPGTFDPPAEFHLFWPARLVSAKQSAKNFAVFYVSSPGAPVETISTRCDAARSVVPCLEDVTFFKKGPLKGSISATVVRPSNGHMR
jgi:hypothetical protein